MPERALHERLAARWYDRRPAAWLRPLAALYGLGVGLRRAAYARGWIESRHPGVPVIVVGNLTVGGTGKTPLVNWLAMRLRAAGERPGIVLRGYRGEVRGARLVAPGDDPAVVGDEALLLARRTGCPVAVAKQRAKAAWLLTRRDCTLVLADDGLQHLALRRDLSIVVIDGARGFGNGALLPAGPLREPAARLAAADVVVVHGADARGVARDCMPLHMHLVPGALRAVDGTREERLGTLAGATVHGVAGIGNPQRFFDQLRGLGATVIEHAFPDHHHYRAQDLAFGDTARIVMTEKDAVKCGRLATPGMWYLPVTAELPEADAARLLRTVTAAVHAKGGGAGA